MRAFHWLRPGRGLRAVRARAPRVLLAAGFKDRRVGQQLVDTLLPERRERSLLFRSGDGMRDWLYAQRRRARAQAVRHRWLQRPGRCRVCLRLRRRQLALRLMQFECACKLPALSLGATCAQPLDRGVPRAQVPPQLFDKGVRLEPPRLRPRPRVGLRRASKHNGFRRRCGCDCFVELLRVVASKRGQSLRRFKKCRLQLRVQRSLARSPGFRSLSQSRGSRTLCRCAECTFELQLERSLAPLPVRLLFFRLRSRRTFKLLPERCLAP
mmetsp:Transcript_10140/g.25517  ORF Transcript_10140/g.25517 Transcript_10140/m.25517 type:complete len:268 (+) Transcript_10140:352-1155(+)